MDPRNKFGTNIRDDFETPEKYTGSSYLFISSITFYIGTPMPFPDALDEFGTIPRSALYSISSNIPSRSIMDPLDEIGTRLVSLISNQLQYTILDGDPLYI